MNNSIVKTLLGILLSVLLCFVIFFEFKTGFELIEKHMDITANSVIEAAEKLGKNSVSVEEPSYYTEVPDIDQNGEVIKIEGYDVKIKVNGSLKEGNSVNKQEYYYESATFNNTQSLIVFNEKENIEGFRKACNDYWSGQPESILQFYNYGNVNAEDIEYLQQTFTEGNIPVVHNTKEDTYRMFINAEDCYLIINCTEPFHVTSDKVTVHYGDPSANPMIHHTYSDYEELAAKNTIESIKNKDKENADNPYTSGEVVGTSATYTSTADNNLRKQMVSYSNYNWAKDGKCSETQLFIDITSEEAIKSKWKFTNNSFSYQHAGLQINTLVATRSVTEFSLKGNINNLIDAERPYVIVLKYLNDAGELIHLDVLDNRNKPLEPSGVAKFETKIDSEKDKVDTSTINAVMFEVY